MFIIGRRFYHISSQYFYFRHKSHLIQGNSELAIESIAKTFTVREDFVNDQEEENLVKEVEPRLKRYKYEDSHIDHVIKSFKEIEVSQFNASNQLVINRIKDETFKNNEVLLGPVHVIDLADDGFIMPHIDSLRYCGSKIAGLSLLSDSVMRFTQSENPTTTVDVWLKRKSLYIMEGASRYNFKHAILSKDKSIFNGKLIQRGRRISIICRCEPNHEPC